MLSSAASASFAAARHSIGDLIDRERLSDTLWKMRAGRERLIFGGGLTLSLLVGPAVSTVLQSWLGPIRAQDAGVQVAMIWFAAFLVAGAVAGNAVAGRRGQFAFSVAFAVVPVAAAVVVGQSIGFHDDIRWRPYERILDVALFNVAYPITFALMGSAGVGIVTRSWSKAASAARIGAVSGTAGGVIFSGAVSFLPLRGYIEAIAVVASLAIPAVSCAGPIHRLLQNGESGP